MKIFTSNFIYLLVICRERLALYNFPAGENVCKLFWLTPSTKLSQAKYTTGPNIINHFFFLIQKTNLKHNQSKYTKYKPHHPFMYKTASSVKKKKKKNYIYTDTHTHDGLKTPAKPKYTAQITLSSFISLVQSTIQCIKIPSQAKYKTPSLESVFKLTPSAKLSQAKRNIQSAPASPTTCIDNLVNHPFCPANRMFES